MYLKGSKNTRDDACMRMEVLCLGGATQMTRPMRPKRSDLAQRRVQIWLYKGRESLYSKAGARLAVQAVLGDFRHFGGRIYPK